MIREMREEDLKVILKMEEELFPSSPWPRKEFLYELHENPYAHLLVLEEEGHILGYADLWLIFEQAQLANIAVSKHAQGNGNGQKLMDEVLYQSIDKECETISLEVRVSNTPAIHLYEKNGFITVSTRKKYYEDGEDAYLMVKPIGGLTNGVNTSN